MRTVYEPWYRLYCLPWAVVKRCYNSACFAGWHGESIMGLSGMGLGRVQRRNVHHVIWSIPQHAESHAARAAACRHAKPTKELGGTRRGCEGPGTWLWALLTAAQLPPWSEEWHELHNECAQSEQWYRAITTPGSYGESSGKQPLIQGLFCPNSLTL